MDTLLKIVKEFWIPALLATIWTTYICISHTGVWDFKVIASAFGPSFFLFSWGTGQYFRVRKQTHVDKNLQTIESRLSKLIDTLDEKTKDLISHITGGDSFCYLNFGFSDPANQIGTVGFTHQGSHNVYDVRVRITDLACLENVFKNNQPLTLGQCDTNYQIGDLTPNHAGLLFRIPLTGKNLIRYNAFFAARNGDHTQLLRIARSDNKWFFATKIRRGNAEIFELIQEKFPVDALTNDQDWNVKLPPSNAT